MTDLMSICNRKAITTQENLKIDPIHLILSFIAICLFILEFIYQMVFSVMEYCLKLFSLYIENFDYLQ